MNFEKRSDLRIKDIGERNLIDRLSSLLPVVDASVSVGVGDDCAVVCAPSAPWTRQVMTTDMLAEGTHFLSGDEDHMHCVGRKAMTSNISDIAAMGGKPLYALVSIGASGDVRVSLIEALYRGMADEAREFGVSIIGGDTIGVGDGQGIVVSIMLTGVCREDIPMPLRRNARSGQDVYVTGMLGGSKAGLLFVLESKLRETFPDRAVAETLLQRHFEPKARVCAGQTIAGICQDLAMIDVSDSLVNELELICESSGVVAELYLSRVPHFPGVDAVAAFRHDAVDDYVLYSGEEYELLFCTSTEEGVLRKALDCAGLKDLPLSRIGRIVSGDVACVRVLDAAGSLLPSANLTFSHF